jgi:5-hydroxyisourate hydrolase / 2-oxo-4-hydroxy-4-carboxy-5-ureidoimidazoline decarboxylase
MTLAALNGLDEEGATRELLRCCGSTRWAREMAGARPFTSVEAVTAAADTIWTGLDRADWLEAFAAHPIIGAGLPADPSAGAPGAKVEARSAKAGDAGWAAAEQAGAASASTDVLARLVEANREYEARFGFIFIVCATGKSAEEMLQLLEGRLDNDPLIEVRVAADEQRKITRLRIAKLLESSGRITTHVLDTSRGCPGAGMGVVLDVRNGDSWSRVGQGTTDANGRLTTLAANQSMIAGDYRLTFDTGGYLRARGVADAFFPDVTITFTVADASAHFHVPLLLSPFGYSTYRGS